VAYLKDPTYYLPELHGRVFTLPEIRSILESLGSPDGGWGLALPEHLANYVEAQVWNRQLLLDFRLQQSHTCSEAVQTPQVTTKITHLEDAVGALGVKLSQEEVAYLEEPYVPHPIVGHQ